MRVFQNPRFERFARKAAIPDGSLCAVAFAIARGRFDVDLGQGVYKQRVARAGSGKSGGFRTIVVLRVETAAFFVYGFRKSEAANISLGELHQLKKLAKGLQTLSAAQLQAELNAGYLIEVKCDGKALP